MLSPITIRPARNSEHEYRAIAALAERAPSQELCDFEYACPQELRDFDEGFAAVGSSVKRYLAYNPHGAPIAYATAFRPTWSRGSSQYWTVLRVEPSYRRQRVGRMLCERVLADASTTGAGSLAMEVQLALPDMLAAANRFGFQETLRSVELRLDTRSCDIGKHCHYLSRLASHGIEIVTLAVLKKRDPQWLAKLHKLYLAISRDVPIPERPTLSQAQLATLIEHSPGALPESFFVAVDGENYAGQSFLHHAPDGHTLLQKLTGVLPSYRGLGIAQALKVHTILYAQTHGYSTISTWVETCNEAMLGINQRFGFVIQSGGVALVERPVE